MEVCATLDDCLHIIFKKIISEGISTKPSRGAAIELLGETFRLSNPLARISLSNNRSKVFSALGELFWYLRATNSLDVIKYYIPRYKHESEDGYTINGGYGPRLFDAAGVDQVANIVEILKKKPNSRRAVITLFRPDDLARPRKEVPCTISLQFLLRDKKLNCIATMRSSDAYFGLAHDLFVFTMLQEIIAREIGCELGFYQHAAGSLHIYENMVEDARSYLAEGHQSRKMEMPKMPDQKIENWRTIILKGEESFRQSDGKKKLSPEPDITNLLPYWTDLYNLLKVYRLTRVKAPAQMINEAKGLASRFSAPIYEELALARLDGRAPTTQTLELT